MTAYETSRRNSHLFPPGIDDRLGPYLRRLWQARHFMWADARASLLATHANLRLGRAWLVLEPLLSVSVYFVLFSLALRGNRALATDHLSYLVVGRTSYSTFSQSVMLAASSIRKNSALPLDLPRAALPVGRLLNSMMRYPYELVATIAVLFFRGFTPSITWLLAPVLSLMGYVLSLGIGLTAARIAAKTPDTRSVLATALRFGFYGAGTILPIEVYIRTYNPEALTIYTWANPTFGLVKLHQWAFLGYEGTDLRIALTSVILWTLITVPIAVVWFVRGEHGLREATPRRRQG